jgi:hypothetical protein
MPFCLNKMDIQSAGSELEPRENVSRTRVSGMFAPTFAPYCAAPPKPHRQASYFLLVNLYLSIIYNVFYYYPS